MSALNCIYLALTPKMHSSAPKGGSPLRPIKIGKATCLLDRLNALNKGFYRNDSLSPPLALRDGWQIFAATAYMFDDVEVRKLERDLLGFVVGKHGAWRRYDAIKKDVLAKVKHFPTCKGQDWLNGLSEIVAVDVGAVPDLLQQMKAFPWAQGAGGVLMSNGLSRLHTSRKAKRAIPSPIEARWCPSKCDVVGVERPICPRRKPRSVMEAVASDVRAPGRE